MVSMCLSMMASSSSWSSSSTSPMAGSTAYPLVRTHLLRLHHIATSSTPPTSSITILFLPPPPPFHALLPIPSTAPFSSLPSHPGTQSSPMSTLTSGGSVGTHWWWGWGWRSFLCLCPSSGGGDGLPTLRRRHHLHRSPGTQAFPDGNVGGVQNSPEPSNEPSPQGSHPLSEPSPQGSKPLSEPSPQGSKPLSEPSPQGSQPLSEPSPQRSQPAKDHSINRIMDELKRYGMAGVLSYGLFNTGYYLITFLVVWFYVAPAPTKLGYVAAVERFLKVMAMVWAGSQVTKILRAGGALALAPLVDKGLTWFTDKFKFKSKAKAFGTIVALCLGLALLLFVLLTLLWA